MGIIWSKITLDKIRRVPILRKLREIEREAGKDVQIYEDIHGMPEKEEGEEGGEDGGKIRVLLKGAWCLAKKLARV